MRLSFRPFARSTETADAASRASPRWRRHPLRRHPPDPRGIDLALSIVDPPHLRPSHPDAPLPGRPDLGPPISAPPISTPPIPAPPIAWRHDADLTTGQVQMWQDPPRRWPDTDAPADDERLRPLYARVLRLRHVEPGGVLCFVFFEGTMVLGFLLALAELVSWWGMLMLPASVALMVKINDVVAAAVARSAARVPELEQERFRRELQPAVGRAPVPQSSRAPEAMAAAYRPARAGAPANRTVSSVARVRPELAPVRARPRPIPPTGSPDDRTGHAEPPAGPGERSGWEERPPVRRARNAHPVDRGRRAPPHRPEPYPPDRRDPAGGAGQWIRQSARERYGPDDRRG